MTEDEKLKLTVHSASILFAGFIAKGIETSQELSVFRHEALAQAGCMIAEVRRRSHEEKLAEQERHWIDRGKPTSEPKGADRPPYWKGI